MKTKIEKDIEATIRLLRFMTKGEGFAAISVFDAGAGGGFSEGSVTVNLERSGMIFPKNSNMTPEELKATILESLKVFDRDLVKINEHYSSKDRKWND